MQCNPSFLFHPAMHRPTRPTSKIIRHHNAILVVSQTNAEIQSPLVYDACPYLLCPSSPLSAPKSNHLQAPLSPLLAVATLTSPSQRLALTLLAHHSAFPPLDPASLQPLVPPRSSCAQQPPSPSPPNSSTPSP